MSKNLVAPMRSFALIISLLLTIGVSADAQAPAAATTAATTPNQGTPAPPTQQQQQQSPATAAAQPKVEEWRDDFDGERLDESKWETYTFEGGGGLKIEVKDKQLRMRGAGGSRSGVRTKQTFNADVFRVDATLTKVGRRSPQPGEEAFQPGFAILTVLFDGNAANRVEWLLNSDGNLEAWQNVDGRMERVDKRNRATKEKTVTLGIVRDGERIIFLLNGEKGLEVTARGLSSNFKVMVYGFGSTENNWDSVSVKTVKL